MGAFDGTETEVSIFAAVGLDTRLGDHNGAANSVTPVTVPFVPSPAITDTYWCDGRDCLIEVAPVTFNPTTDPTFMPTEHPSANPSKHPTAISTRTPTSMTGSPSVMPTDNPTMDPVTAAPTEMPTFENDSSSYSMQTLLVFLIVFMMTLCSLH